MWRFAYTIIDRGRLSEREEKKVEFLGRGRSRRNAKNVPISACIATLRSCISRHYLSYPLLLLVCWQAEDTLKSITRVGKWRHASRYFFNWLSLRNTLFEISWRWKGSWLFSKRKIHHFSRRCIKMQFQKRKKLFRLLLAIYDREGERNMVPTDTRVTWIRGWPFIRFATAVIAHLDNFKRTGRGDARKRRTRDQTLRIRISHILDRV